MIEHPDDYKDVDIPALCEKLNCDLIVGDESTLLLDLDNDHALNEFQRVRPVVEQVYPFKSVERYPSRNGNGEHVIIKLVSQSSGCCCKLPWAVTASGRYCRAIE
jgi:hypothetical protein